MNRKAMELSINFLVGIIFGIVLLGLGTAFAMNIFKQADKLVEQGLPDFFEQEALNCVERGDKVCVPMSKLDAKILKQTSFGLVINNIYGEPKRFRPYVVFRRGETDKGVAIPSASIDPSEWTFTSFTEQQLENNEHVTVEIPIRPPKGAKRGTYTFNINVCFDSDENIDSKCNSDYKSLYGTSQQITVNVN